MCPSAGLKQINILSVSEFITSQETRVIKSTRVYKHRSLVLTIDISGNLGDHNPIKKSVVSPVL